MKWESDKALYLAVKQGDKKAFEYVYKSWYEQLVHFSNEYLRDLEASKNIVQNIFLRLWEKHGWVNADSNLKSFLYMATRNACLSHMRHVRVEENYFKKALINPEDFQLNYDALEELKIDQIDFSRLEDLIRETIESLPERCREVFVLSRYHEMKNREIAEKLGISIKAVEAHITRALTKLRRNTSKTMPELALFMILTRKS